LKVISLDFGTKRIGVAVGDTDLKIAVAKEVIPNDSRVFARIEKLIKETGAELLVIGLPLTPRGREGERAKLVKEFARKISEKLPSIEIEFWDERYTTQEAMRRTHGLKGKKNLMLDAISALIILEEYLDNL
jgi:putative Holliday junction resolvase